MIKDVLFKNFDKNIIIDITPLITNHINYSLLAEALAINIIIYRSRCFSSPQEIILVGPRNSYLTEQMQKLGLTLIWVEDVESALTIISNL